MRILRTDDAACATGPLSFVWGLDTDGMFSLKSESAFISLPAHHPSDRSPLHSLRAIVCKVRQLHSLTLLASSWPFYWVLQQLASVSCKVKCPGMSLHSSTSSILHSCRIYHLASTRLPGTELDSCDSRTWATAHLGRSSLFHWTHAYPFHHRIKSALLTASVPFALTLYILRCSSSWTDPPVMT